MRARLTLLICAAVCTVCFVGCGTKEPDAKEQAAKLDRSKIDDEVKQGGESGMAPGSKPSAAPSGATVPTNGHTSE